MHDSTGPAAPASGLDFPDFATLAADPEIAPLLDFKPVPRKVRRPDGWTPDLQRELIARLAATGTLQQSVWQMGKHATGAEALYKHPDAYDFRARWDAALALGRRRNGLDSRPPFAGEVPGITRRQPRQAPVDDEWRDVTPASPDEEWAMMVGLFERYAMKLHAERQCRRDGRIAAADFYLRQATFLEIAMEMGGGSVLALLRDGRIAGRDIFDIAETPLTRILAQIRAAAWAEDGEPERPVRPAHLLVDCGACSIEPGEFFGRAGPVPGWADPDEWPTLGLNEQKARTRAQQDKDAAAYAAWLKDATADAEERRRKAG